MIRLAQILELPALSLTPLAVVDPDAGVSWVATSELDDPRPFLEGGEILLTTGLTERTGAGWRELVRRCLAAGVVAIGFGVGLTHDEAPAALVESAREEGLNLFTVPHHVPFIAISRAVAELLEKAERLGIRESLDHQRMLTRIAVSNPGGAAVLEALGTIVDGEAILTNPRGDLLAGTAHGPRNDDLLDRARPLVARLVGSDGRGAASEVTVSTRLTVHPVGIGDEVDAYLVLSTDGPLTVPLRSAVTTSIALLALDRRRAQAERQADRRLRSGVYSLLIRGELAAAQALFGDTSPGTGLPPGPAVVVRAQGDARMIEAALNRLETQVGLADRCLPARVVPTEGSSPPWESLAIVVDEATAASTDFTSTLHGLTAGVGPTVAATDLRSSESAALDALAFATERRPIVRWSELSEQGVDALLAPSALQAYATELLRGIVNRADGTELLDTLHAFLLHNGHLGAAARSLGVHRNTMTNRLAAAEATLGRSLLDPQTRADLWICLKSRPTEEQPARL